jgi:hypothetical protein
VVLLVELEGVESVVVLLGATAEVGELRVEVVRFAPLLVG